jgi:hypothetical protein
MKTLRHKRGDTFIAACVRRHPVTGAVLDITSTTIQAQVRRGSFVATLSVAVTSAAAGEYTLSATAAQTASWPAGGLAVCDVQYSDAGVVASSDTFMIEIVEDVTQ